LIISALGESLIRTKCYWRVPLWFRFLDTSAVLAAGNRPPFYQLNYTPT
jgi:hypothetical protein